VNFFLNGDEPLRAAGEQRRSLDIRSRGQTDGFGLEEEGKPTHSVWKKRWPRRSMSVEPLRRPPTTDRPPTTLRGGETNRSSFLDPIERWPTHVDRSGRLEGEEPGESRGQRRSNRLDVSSVREIPTKTVAATSNRVVAVEPVYLSELERLKARQARERRHSSTHARDLRTNSRLQGDYDVYGEHDVDDSHSLPPVSSSIARLDRPAKERTGPRPPTQPDGRNLRRRHEPTSLHEPSTSKRLPRRIHDLKKLRETAHTRRTVYGAAVQKYRPTPGETWINCGRGVKVSQKELNFLKRYFDELDVDGDGELDPDEIHSKVTEAFEQKHRSSLGFTSDKEWNEAKRRIEHLGGGEGLNLGLLANSVGHEGPINFKTMLKLMLPKATRAGITELATIYDTPKVSDGPLYDANDLAHLRDLWKIWDTDGNGELDEYEFRIAIESLKVTSNDAMTLFLALDDDGNGYISFDEFARWWLTDNAGDAEHLDFDKPAEPRKFQQGNSLTKGLYEENWALQLKKMGLAQNSLS